MVDSTKSEATKNPLDGSPTSKKLICPDCGKTFERDRQPTGIMARFLPTFCPKCQAKADQKWKEQEAANVEEAKRNAVAIKAERQKMAWIKALGGLEPYDDYTFEQYDPNLNGTHQWLDVIKNKFNHLTQNLFVFGPVGTGKTHLTTAYLRRVLEQAGTARFFRKAELVAACRGSKHFLSEAELLDNIYTLADTLDAVVIDDIEDEPNTPTAQKVIKYFFDRRKSMKRHGIITTSNKPLVIKDDGVTKFPLAEYLGVKSVDRISGHLIFGIPQDTPSARGLLKLKRKNVS